MTKGTRAAFVFGAFAVQLACASQAQAEFVVCNRSFDVINLAIGQSQGDRFGTEGWWTIGTNQCATPIKSELQTRYIYIYAQDVFGRPMIAGEAQMCVGEKKFSVTGIEGCRARGLTQAGFQEIDTGSAGRWTIFFEPPGSG